MHTTRSGERLTGLTLPSGLICAHLLSASCGSTSLRINRLASSRRRQAQGSRARGALGCLISPVCKLIHMYTRSSHMSYALQQCNCWLAAVNGIKNTLRCLQSPTTGCSCRLFHYHPACTVRLGCLHNVPRSHHNNCSAVHSATAGRRVVCCVTWK
jgi:hypothetical protein